MPTYRPIILALFVLATTAHAQQASTRLTGSADSQYVKVRARLKARNYRIDVEDSIHHRLVVRAPDQETSVEVRIEHNADSAHIVIQPLGSEGISAMQALLVVTHDATIGLPGEVTAESSDSGELPKTQWRPELFVSPQGKLWMARGGLYRADSLRGGWRRVFGNPGDPVDPDALVIGLNMAIVDDDRAILGLPALTVDTTGPWVYRTVDRGKTWAPVAVAELEWVDAMAAVGPSAWLFGTRWENDTTRRALFLRSADAGATWQPAPLPAQLNDVTHVYRASASRAYVATIGSNPGPVFWGTTDGGDTWTAIPTPHDKGLLEIPSYGVRVEQIATAGPWLVVREYGTMFVSRADSIGWKRLKGFEYIAADLSRDGLFALTDSHHAAMLDNNLRVLWTSRNRIPKAQERDVEQVLAHAGTGYVSTSHAEVYEARDGALGLVRPRSSP